MGTPRRVSTRTVIIDILGENPAGLPVAAVRKKVLERYAVDPDVIPQYLSQMVTQQWLEAVKGCACTHCGRNSAIYKLKEKK